MDTAASREEGFFATTTASALYATDRGLALGCCILLLLIGGMVRGNFIERQGIFGLLVEWCSTVAHLQL